MNIMTYIIIISSLVPIIVFMLSYLLFLRSYNDRSKSSPFECGFDPKNKARLPFSLRFFMLAIIFIVFDIEIVLLMPIPLMLLNFNEMLTLMITLFFTVLLFIGLLHEWVEGTLAWKN
uniref:NADH-ubiquinone oxidoreductase chain 3 n=1 Tax=Paracanthobdella livanowi TaxID=2905687 RepID=A0A9E8G7Q2_9ANNE|nr:NADH dehydrogenase subunit 3 [Paracanthobdella livanowi]UZT67757.1 NADH dehydrogenase subunit 3 [Paracanthobdella livanowi]